MTYIFGRCSRRKFQSKARGGEAKQGKAKHGMDIIYDVQIKHLFHSALGLRVFQFVFGKKKKEKEKRRKNGGAAVLKHLRI